MLFTLIVLSTASIKNETPPTKLPKLQCLNPVEQGGTVPRGVQLEASNDIGTEKCIAIPDKSKPSRKVIK